MAQRHQRLARAKRGRRGEGGQWRVVLSVQQQVNRGGYRYAPPPPTPQVRARTEHASAHDNDASSHTLARRYGHIAPVCVGLKNPLQRLKMRDRRRTSPPPAELYKHDLPGDVLRVERADSGAAASRSHQSHVTQKVHLPSLPPPSRQPNPDCTRASRDPPPAPPTTQRCGGSDKLSL